MRIVLISPGSGDNFYCENCLRDQASVAALRRAGHDVFVVPMYLPLGPESGATEDTPIFFGGVNVYLQQKSALFRRTPRWIDRLFDSRRLLRWAGRRADMTSARELGETTLSMLRGEEGRQIKELRRLLEFLAGDLRPDVVCLSNALLIGLAGPIRRELSAPVLCQLHDEDGFLDSLDEPLRSQAWRTLAEQAADVDLFLPVSRYYADVMARHLGLPAGRMRVVYPGVDVAGYTPATDKPSTPVIGFLSRICRDKGLDLLVEALLALRGEAGLAELKLRVAGGSTGKDEPFIDEVRARIDQAGAGAGVEFLPGFSGPERRAFLPTLSVLSVPERTGEALGLYALEALAAGVPLVLPANGAFPELVEATSGGVLFEPGSVSSLTGALRRVLCDADLAAKLAGQGRAAVLEKFTEDEMARAFIDACMQAVGQRSEG